MPMMEWKKTISHIVGFHLCDVLEKAKLWGWEKVEWLSGVGMNREETEDF